MIKEIEASILRVKTKDGKIIETPCRPDSQAEILKRIVGILKILDVDPDNVKSIKFKEEKQCIDVRWWEVQKKYLDDLEKTHTPAFDVSAPKIQTVKR